MKKPFLALFLIAVLSVVSFFFWLSPRYAVPILMYHNIGYEQGSFFVSPENFAKQMEYIKEHGYEVITLDELVENIKSKKPLKKNKVVITFDDGYKDSLKYAYPVLKKYGFPATIFLVADFTGKYFTGTGKEFLSWDDVIFMSKNGVSFGAHTKTHFELGEPWDEGLAIEEITGSKKIIEQRIGLPVDYFCYPSGAFCEKAKKAVADAGYKGAVTTNRGSVSFNKDVYELKRIKMTNSDAVKPFSFWAKLSGYYNVFRSKRNPY